MQVRVCTYLRVGYWSRRAFDLRNGNISVLYSDMQCNDGWNPRADEKQYSANVLECLQLKYLLRISARSPVHIT